MYGNEIHLLGETGYGISVEFAKANDPAVPTYPQFNIFHVSDGFRQSLYSTGLFLGEIPEVHNAFHERIYELMQTRPHG